MTELSKKEKDVLFELCENGWYDWGRMDYSERQKILYRLRDKGMLDNSMVLTHKARLLFSRHKNNGNNPG